MEMLSNHDNIVISTDKYKLDRALICDFIAGSYWAKGRSAATMETCINNSLNFGVYHNGRQIGYARLVTDYAQFAYIMDLFIVAACRGKGYSKKLMQYIIDLDELKRVKVWRLATSDAHSLYKQFGFAAIAAPDQLMELIK